MIKKNGLCMIVLMACLVSLFTACGNRSQENISEAMEQIENEQSVKAEGLDAILAVDEETWVDSLSLDGKTISIDAKVTVPDVDSMKVVSLEAQKMDAEYKKNLLEKLCDQAYVLDEQNPPQWYIDSNIEWLENQKQNYLAGETEPGDESNYKYYINLLEKWKRRDTDAFEDRVSENYEEWAYYGEYEGNMYSINFVPADDGYIMSWTPVDYTGMTHFKPASGKMCSGEISHPDGISDDAEKEYLNMYENHCEMSLEEAQQLAKDFLAKLGYTELNAVSVCPLSWYDTEGDFSEPYVDGYVFTFYREVDGIVMDLTKTVLDCLKHGDTDKEADVVENYRIAVTDAGVIEGGIFRPYVEKEVLTESAKLLSYQQVKDIFLSLLSKDRSYAKFMNSTETLNALELTYYLMEDNGSYAIIPVWRLEHQSIIYDINAQENVISSIKSTIMINAIDGSVIDPGDEKNK